MRRLLFSVTSKDFEMQTFCTGGHGGMNQNRRKMGVRLIHKASGARAEAREERHQMANKKRAFLRLVETPQFKNWHRIECARRLSQPIPESKEEIKDRINKMVDEQINSGDILVETF